MAWRLAPGGVLPRAAYCPGRCISRSGVMPRAVSVGRRPWLLPPCCWHGAARVGGRLSHTCLRSRADAAPCCCHGAGRVAGRGPQTPLRLAREPSDTLPVCKTLPTALCLFARALQRRRPATFDIAWRLRVDCAWRGWLQQKRAARLGSGSRRRGAGHGQILGQGLAVNPRGARRPGVSVPTAQGSDRASLRTPGKGHRPGVCMAKGQGSGRTSLYTPPGRVPARRGCGQGPELGRKPRCVPRGWAGQAWVWPGAGARAQASLRTAGGRPGQAWGRPGAGARAGASRRPAGADFERQLYSFNSPRG